VGASILGELKGIRLSEKNKRAKMRKSVKTGGRNDGIIKFFVKTPSRPFRKFGSKKKLLSL